MSQEKKKIAVIGGGFTGLTAAYRLTKEGYDVTLYEKANVWGGLVSGFTLEDGTPLERAYHFLYTTDEHMLGIVAELGIRDKLTFHPSSIQAHYKGKEYSLVTPIDLLKFTPISFIDRIRTGLVGLYLQNVKNWEKLTQITAYDWLRKYNGKRATKLIWEPLLKGKFDIYYDKITMAWLWGRIKQRQTSKAKGELTERLGYFEGGFQLVVKKFIEYLEKNGATLYTNTTIEAIRHNDTTDAVTITVDGQDAVYDAVVSTLPSPVFSKVIAGNQSVDQAYIEKLNSIDYLAAVLMIFTTDKPITDIYWHQIHDEDAPFLVMLSLTGLTGREQFNGQNIYYIGDYIQHSDPLFASMSEEEIREKWYNGVKRLFPDFNQADVKESYVFKYANAQHIVDIGYDTKKLPDYKTPIPHVFLANFSQIFPQDRGTNYAVRDGNKIAQMVIDDLSSHSSSNKDA